MGIVRRTGARGALTMALLLALVLGGSGLLSASDAGASDAANLNGVAVTYPGPVQPGLERIACVFYDGPTVMNGMIVQGHFVAHGTMGDLRYKARVNFPPGYAVRSLACTPSILTGNLVVVIGGLIVNTSSQQTLTIATDYYALPPVRTDYSQYVRGEIDWTNPEREP